MRIISKFHDYYDTAMGYGQDQSVVYVRDQKDSDEAPSQMKLCHRIDRDAPQRYAICYPFAIAFCGKIYRGFSAVVKPSDATPTRKACYTKDELIQFLASHKINITEKSYRGRWIPFWDRSWTEYLAQPQCDASAESWFIERKIAVMVSDLEVKQEYALTREHETGIIINPCLKRYEFYRIFDAYQTFQELSMFVGGILPGADADMAVVNDKDRYAQRGFDVKWGFRKKG